MGTIRNGGNGAFSGKAGSFIGSSWKGVDYIKGIPKLSKTPATEKQLVVQAKFKLVTTFMALLVDVVKIGWKGQTNGKQTPMNAAVQHALQWAVIGTYPAYEIDHAMIRVAKGTLGAPLGVQANALIGGAVNLSWNYTVGMLGENLDDKAVIVVYNATQGVCMAFNQIAQRTDGNAELALPIDFEGNDLHIWFFFINREATKRSNSIHLGPVVPIS